MKFSTPMGACLGKSVHVIFPAVVSMVSVVLADAAAVEPAARFGGVPVGFVCDKRAQEHTVIMTARQMCFCIRAPRKLWLWCIGCDGDAGELYDNERCRP